MSSARFNPVQVKDQGGHAAHAASRPRAAPPADRMHGKMGRGTGGHEERVVIDLTASTPPPKRARRTPSADCAADCPRKQRKERLVHQVLAIVPTADSAAVSRALGFCALDSLADDAAIAAALNRLFADTDSDSSPPRTLETDEQLAERLAAEEQSHASRRDLELARQIAGQDAKFRVAAVAPAAHASKMADSESGTSLPEHEDAGKIHGVMFSLTQCLMQESAAASDPFVAYVCSNVDYFGGVRGVDKGWGCGYRNSQMLISHLLARFQVDGAWNAKARYLYRERLFSRAGIVPSISHIQGLIERAWKKGFDKDGAEQLGGRLSGTQKWIGSTEVAVLLRAQGVRANIIDFSSSVAPFGADLFNWVLRYFERGRSQTLVPAAAHEGSGGGGSVGTACNGGRLLHSLLPPLYLQHQGHSRLIVGAIRRQDARQLLILDPGQHRAICEAMSTQSLNLNKWRKLTQVPLERFNFCKQFQLVMVEDDELHVAFDQNPQMSAAGAGGEGYNRVGGSFSRQDHILMDGEEMERSKMIVARERIGDAFSHK